MREQEDLRDRIHGIERNGLLGADSQSPIRGQYDQEQIGKLNEDY
jgi:hypothetical protein